VGQKVTVIKMDPEKSRKAIEKIKEHFPGDLGDVKSEQISKNHVYWFEFRDSEGTGQKVLIWFELDRETASIYPRIMDTQVAERAFELLNECCPNADLSLLQVTVLSERPQGASKDLETPDIFDLFLGGECYWFKNFKDNEGNWRAGMLCIDRDEDGHIVHDHINIRYVET
jgi:hypothetical protein